MARASSKREVIPVQKPRPAGPERDRDSFFLALVQSFSDRHSGRLMEKVC
jgi:hypothetical protein